MKELNKLALILRALGFRAGTEEADDYCWAVGECIARKGGYTWDIWKCATTEKAEPTITPGAKVIVLNATETTSGAKPIMIDVGTMAKVVHISLGVPPECTEAVSGALSVASGPPNIHGVRPAVAAAGLNNAAVGYCLGVVGKVYTHYLCRRQGAKE